MQETELISRLWKLYEPKIDENLPIAGTNRDAATALLSIAAGLLRVKGELPEGLREWIATGLMHLAHGQSTEDAFNFPARPRGRRTGETATRVFVQKQRIALLVEYLVKSKGMTVERARTEVAAAESVSEATVRQAWEEQHKQMACVLMAGGFLK